jgi:anti-anti-sigma factor
MEPERPKGFTLMSEPKYRYVSSQADPAEGIQTVKFTEAQIRGDELAEALRDELLDAVQRSGLKKVILDFELVTYISSAGLRPLIRLRRKLQDENGHMRICNLHPNVAEVFQTVRLFSAPFEIQPDLATARNSLKDASPSE